MMVAEATPAGLAELAAPPDPSVIWSRTLWICLAFNAVFASFVLTFLQTYAQRYTTPVKAMLMFQFEPIVATAAAIAVLGEAFSWLAALGAAIIIVGVLASELGEAVWARLTIDPQANAPTETALPPVPPTYTHSHKK